jgi:hypothetical protein
VLPYILKSQDEPFSVFEKIKDQIYIAKTVGKCNQIIPIKFPCLANGREQPNTFSIKNLKIHTIKIPNQLMLPIQISGGLIHHF